LAATLALRTKLRKTPFPANSQRFEEK